MMIPVIYQNGRHDMVKDFLLTKLIDQEEISQFKRSEGWVDIKKGKLRRTTGHYFGPERRQQEAALPAELVDIF